MTSHRTHRPLLSTLINPGEMLAYFFFAGLAAFVNFASRFLFNLAFDFRLSVVLAYFTGMFINFTLSKRYLFSARHSGSTRSEFAKFFLVALGGLAVTFGVSITMLKLLEAQSLGIEVSRAAAHLCGMAAGFMANYFGHKFFSFRKTGLYKLLKGMSA